MMSSQRAGWASRVVLALLAVVFYAGFFGMGETASGTEVGFFSPWTRMTEGELTFWLASIFFLFPAGVCAGLAFEPIVVPVFLRFTTALRALSSREWTFMLFISGFMAVLLYMVFNQVALLGFPITDDEYSARFGGQVMAMGKAMAPMPAPDDFFPHLFILARDGAWTAGDFTGVQLAWALSELTQTGGWLFHILAMAPIPALMFVLAKTRGRIWGWWAGAIFLFSPMAFTLSYTTHAHVLSRGFLSLALAAFYLPWREQRLLHWVVGAFSLGFALVCRPFETIAIGAPFIALVAIPEALKSTQAKKALFAIAVGALFGLAIMGLHNWALSGNPIVSARFLGNEFPHPYAWRFKPPWSPGEFWERFGANTSYNTMMFGIWFLALPGIFLTLVGTFVNRRTKALALGVVAALAMAMLHDDHGLHLVGPIHYSECAVPLTILAVEGLRRSYYWLLVHRFDWRRPLGVMLLVLPVTFGTFSFWQARALHEQAGIHAAMYGLLRTVEQRPAVLVAPKYFEAWANVPSFAMRGSFVYEWRRPRPDLSEPVIIAHNEPGSIEALRKMFPSRHFYEMKKLGGPPWLRIEPLP